MRRRTAPIPPKPADLPEHLRGKTAAEKLAWANKKFAEELAKKKDSGK